MAFSSREPSRSLPRMAKVYSYIRFSTLEQEKGDSYRRQLDDAQKYCAANNHVFDSNLTISDRGKSAFSKANLESGRLGMFLKAVQDGDVEPGSILFVESFDRISRADLFSAMGVLGQLLDAGITVVANDREYSKEAIEKNQFLLLEPIFVFIRANEESAQKAKRLREVWQEKRNEGEPLTRRMETIHQITIADNGTGIRLEELNTKFKPYRDRSCDINRAFNVLNLIPAKHLTRAAKTEPYALRFSPSSSIG